VLPGGKRYIVPPITGRWEATPVQKNSNEVMRVNLKLEIQGRTDFFKAQ